MLGLFSGTPEHPLADTKGARELFDRLKRSDPLAAIDEIDSWLESTAHDSQIKPQRRIDILVQLDDLGAEATRKLGREYLILSGAEQGQNPKIWQANRKYWQQLVASYRLVLDQFAADKKMQAEMRPALQTVQIRQLRAYAGALKWDQFRYGPTDPELWGEAGGIYLEAEKGRWLDRKQTLGDGSSATVATEYLRLLLFHAASMDRLRPMEIELAERLLVHLLPAFSLTAQVKPDNAYWVDAGKPLPPTRLAKLPEITPTLRFFATAGALSAIEAIRTEITATNTVPERLGLKNQFQSADIMAVLQHLAAFCAPQPPTRLHARHQVKSWMKVASGFRGVLSALRGNEVAGDSWAMEDVSRGGMRAQASFAGHEELCIGSMVAMCPDGGENWLIGIVRRISRESQALGNVGIETVGRTPCAVRLDGSGLLDDGLLLESTVEAGHVTLLVVSPGTWRDFQPVSFEHNGSHYRLRPLEEHRRGADYVIGRYWAETLPA